MQVQTCFCWSKYTPHFEMNLHINGRNCFKEQINFQIPSFQPCPQPQKSPSCKSSETGRVKSEAVKVKSETSILKTHAKDHDNKCWECDVCKKTFTTKYFLRKHKRLHTGKGPLINDLKRI